jgi:hypothetical protein
VTDTQAAPAVTETDPEVIKRDRALYLMHAATQVMTFLPATVHNLSISSLHDREGVIELLVASRSADQVAITDWLGVEPTYEEAAVDPDGRCAAWLVWRATDEVRVRLPVPVRVPDGEPF